MPGRKTPLVTGEIYHIFNRGVAKMPTFTDESEFRRMTNLMSYYRFSNVPVKYSILVDLPLSQQQKIMKQLNNGADFLIQILCFNLMPNHFHMTLKQVVDNGIAKFIGNISNSFTKYVNKKKNRPGPLFQGRFKAVHVESDEQLLHLSRYQHLNQYTDGLVRTFDELLSYPYSSLSDYAPTGNVKHDFVDTKLILSYFKDKKAYLKFVRNQRDHQRNIARIKKLLK